MTKNAINRTAMTEYERRWRLILGQDSNGALPDSLTATDRARDLTLHYLYEREHQARGAGLGDTKITPTQWLQQVRQVFPKSTVEILQKQAIERYRLTELLTDVNTLRQAEPNMTLVQTLLSFRNQLSAEVMAEVRRIISKVCQELEEALSQKVQAYFSARKLRHLHGGRKQLSNLDWSRSIRRNLKNYNKEADLLILERMLFYKNEQSHIPWDLYIVIDQSGSMLDSLIHSAVLAAIFCRLSALKTHLILFDTSIIDLTDKVDDPVESLLSVQLGGGTNIGNAMGYVNDIITQPARSMVVLISDFCEGADPGRLYQHTANMKDSGVQLLGLAALNDDCNPDYDHNIARELTGLGLNVAAMTPDHLAEWIAKTIR